MTNIAGRLTEHYTRGGLEAALLAALAAAGKDVERLVPGDLMGADEFHVGGAAATKALAAPSEAVAAPPVAWASASCRVASMASKIAGSPLAAACSFPVAVAFAAPWADPLGAAPGTGAGAELIAAADMPGQALRMEG